ncbi:MAG TPA: hypothetical protein VFJ23_00210 [Candidatus Nitrosotalea sp.]|nr:hypothetical protein [Candidatus Nitrosotalea sp.]
MKSDEIFSIWSAYVRTEAYNHDPLCINYYEKDKSMRLTPMEIHRLVEELLDRLEIKENSNAI